MNNYTDIPGELQALPQWVVHRTKVPYNPRTGYGAKAGKPDTWADFTTAVHATGYDGIGFEFQKENGLIGIDLDTVRDPESGWIDPLALDIIKRAASYTEVSPSGYGFHIICCGSPSLIWHKKPLPPNQIERIVDGKQKTPEIEMYAEKRYFTMTGNVYENYRTITDATELVQELQEKFGKPTGHPLDWDSEISSGFTLDYENRDKDYLSIGLERDSNFRELWDGGRPNGNESADDQALMNKLAYWCNRDTAGMIEAFQRSPYCQQKDDAHNKKAMRPDYLQRTAERAIEDCPLTAEEKDCDWKEQHKPKPEQDFQPKTVGTAALDIFKPVAAFEEQEPEWLVDGWIPKGQITLLASDGGVGKTSVVCNIAAAKSRGKACILDKPGATCEPARVLLLTTEDSISKKLRKKLRLLGGDLNNIIAPDPKLDVNNALRGLKFGSPMLEQVIRKYNPDLCIFDPIQGYVPPDINMGYRNSMRDCMATLTNLGEETSCTFIVICHSNKRRGASGRERISDSSDLWDIARSVIMAGFTGDENNTRYLSNEKNNYAKQQDTVLFTINDSSLPEFAGFSKKHDRDYVQESYTVNVKDQQLNEKLIEALEDEANPFEEVKFSYVSFEEKYSASIWDGKQPKRALDLVKTVLEKDGYSLITKKVKVDGRTERGFTIKQVVDEKTPQQFPLPLEEEKPSTSSTGKTTG